MDSRLFAAHAPLVVGGELNGSESQNVAFDCAAAQTPCMNSRVFANIFSSGSNRNAYKLPWFYHFMVPLS